MGDQDVQVFTTAAAMRQFTRKHRCAGQTVALVPTMGNLHDGHISLVTAARQEADVVVASIYINPTQFAKDEDFDKYPRQREADRALLRAAGCHATFEPQTLYASPAQKSESESVVGTSQHVLGEHETYIQVEQLQRGLCGRSRPTFFRGVATAHLVGLAIMPQVVAKLFNIVEPDVALFGRKDYQQWRLLERMARDLDFPVRIVGLPIVRHDDGLAMSSRNNLLSKEDRARAPCICKALRWAQQATESGEAASAAALCEGVRQRIADGGGSVDYVEAVDAGELQPLDSLAGRRVLVAVAAFFGGVRLIDNIVLEPT